MALFGTIQQMYMSHPVSVVLVTVGCILGFILLILGIVVIVRKYCPSNSKQSNPKKAKCKNTIQLNQQQFRDNLQFVKKGQATQKVADEYRNRDQLGQDGQKGGHYMQFNDQEFIQGVPKKYQSS